jgi:mono/diheme cytochrome c family protein
MPPLALRFAALVAIGFPPHPWVFASLALALLACDRPPAADSLREWTPADHHSNDDDKLATGAQQATASGAGERPRQPPGASGQTDVTQLVDLTWRQQCSACHGSIGKGDGQMGPMVNAPDLTREDWQARATDAEIGAAIKNGRGKMPGFNVPDQVIQGLVARVRASRGR